MSLRPGPPVLDVERQHRPRWRGFHVLSVLGGEKAQSPFSLSALVEDPAPSVNPNPPQVGPVVLVMVDEERDGAIGPDVLEPTQIERRLGLGVDGRVHGAGMENEATRDDVRSTVGARRGQVPDPGVGQPSPSGVTIHDARI